MLWVPQGRRAVEPPNNTKLSGTIGDMKVSFTEVSHSSHSSLLEKCVIERSD